MSDQGEKEEYRLCPHGFHHPPWVHSCDGCWCEGERDQRDYGWPHDTTPKENDIEWSKRDARAKAPWSDPEEKES